MKNIFFNSVAIILLATTMTLTSCSNKTVNPKIYGLYMTVETQNAEPNDFKKSRQYFDLEMQKQHDYGGISVDNRSVVIAPEIQSQTGPNYCYTKGSTIVNYPCQFEPSRDYNYSEFMTTKKDDAYKLTVRSHYDISNGDSSTYKPVKIKVYMSELTSEADDNGRFQKTGQQKLIKESLGYSTTASVVIDYWFDFNSETFPTLLEEENKEEIKAKKKEKKK